MRRLPCCLGIVLGAVAGCTTTAPDVIDAACPAGAVALWSSQESKPSQALVVNGGVVAAQREIEVLGIEKGPGHYAVGTHRYILADGDEQHTETSLVDWDTTTCRAKVVTLDAVTLPLGFATDGVRFYTTNTRDGSAHFRRFDGAGRLQREAALEGVLGDALVLDGDTLYAFVLEFRQPPAPATYALVTMDAETLAVRSRRSLPMLRSHVSSAIAHGGKLIFPLTAEEGATVRALRSLVVLDPTTMAAEELDLGADVPFLLHLVGDTLYVGHTFINPAFGPISTLRHVSVVDLTTKKVSGFDLEAGIIDFRVDDDNLYLLGWLEDNSDTALVLTYRRDSMKKIASMTLKGPNTGGGYYYPAGLLQP
jgi:hypothetical protein